MARFAPSQFVPWRLSIALLLLAGLVRWASAEEPAAPPKPAPPAAIPGLEEALKKKHPTTVADLKAIEQQVRRVVEKVTPCTVGIRIGSSSGSGVIISEDGYVLTAGHVSGKPGLDAVFILHDGREVKGKTLGVNHDIDSGLMKITEAGKWPFVPIAKDLRPLALKPGQWCIATGHPGGYVEGRQPVVRLGRVLFTNDKVICTDCTLVGGDSGGPLFDMNGEIVGIHSRIGWQTTTNFHVPIVTYQDTWDRLVKGDLWGVPLEDSSDASVRPLLGVAGDPQSEPCRISQVFPNSPAARSGIQVGDVIRKFGDQDVQHFEQLARLVKKKEPGDKITIELVRGEQKMSVEVTLSGIHGRLPGGLPDDNDEK